MACCLVPGTPVCMCSLPPSVQMPSDSSHILTRRFVQRAIVRSLPFTNDQVPSTSTSAANRLVPGGAETPFPLKNIQVYSRQAALWHVFLSRGQLLVHKPTRKRPCALSQHPRSMSTRPRGSHFSSKPLKHTQRPPTSTLVANNPMGSR